MKRNLLTLLVLSLSVSLSSGFILAAADAKDESNQKPQLLIKIRNIDQFLNNVDKLASSVQGSNATPPPTMMLRGMLQGADWIDSARSIVIGVVLGEPKPKVVALIPFSRENPGFKAMISAVVGENYYLATIPPEPGAAVSPAMKDALLQASSSATRSGLVIEAAMSALLGKIEPQMIAAMKNMQSLPQGTVGPSHVSPQDAMEMASGMLKILKQAELVRYGFDIAGDVFTLQIDVEAVPNSTLAGILNDPGGESRLMDYSIDMPIQIRSRAHNRADLLNLIMGSGISAFYRKLGMDFEKVGDITKQFTGELAGGVNIFPGGLAMEFIYVLKPGIDGDGFISNTYLPWLENYSSQISNLASRQTGNMPVRIYKRTADSTVAGVTTRGVKADLGAMIPPEKRENGILNNYAVEIRMAAIGDMMFLAPSDAELEALINKSRTLKKSAAQGPMILADVNLGALIRSIQSLVPSTGKSSQLPDDPGNLTVSSEMNNGKLATRLSFNIDVLRKISAAIKQASATAGANSGKPAAK